MSAFEATEAEKDFGSLLELVEKGGQVVITRDGRPVARLVREPRAEDLVKARQQAADEIIAMSKGVTLGGLKIKDLISEGRR